MNASFTASSMRHAGMALALTSIALLGCARKIQVEVPADFHGRVHIVCGGLMSDRPGTLHVDRSGKMDGTTCPSHQADVVVTRAGNGVPVETSVTWMTTGDGLVRELSFDVR